MVRLCAAESQRLFLTGKSGKMVPFKHLHISEKDFHAVSAAHEMVISGGVTIAQFSSWPIRTGWPLKEDVKTSEASGGNVPVEIEE